MQNKTLADISVEELEKILQGDGEVGYVPGNDVGDFCKDHQLFPGKHPVSKKALYSLYSNWSKDPVEEKVFIDALRPFFDVANIYIYLELVPAISRYVDIIKKNKFGLHTYKEFFKEMNLSAGEYLSSLDALISFYKFYTKREKVDKRAFEAVCTALFGKPQEYSDGLLYYKINMEVINETEEA